MLEMTFDKTYAPRLRGNDTIVLESGEVIKASVVKTGGLVEPLVDGTGYTSHFATCPYAKYHRGRGDGCGGGINDSPSATNRNRPRLQHRLR